MAAVNVGNLAGDRDEGGQNEGVGRYDPVEATAQAIYDMIRSYDRFLIEWGGGIRQKGAVYVGRKHTKMRGNNRYRWRNDSRIRRSKKVRKNKSNNHFPSVLPPLRLLRSRFSNLGKIITHSGRGGHRLDPLRDVNIRVHRLLHPPVPSQSLHLFKIVQLLLIRRRLGGEVFFVCRWIHCLLLFDLSPHIFEEKVGHDGYD